MGHTFTGPVETQSLRAWTTRLTVSASTAAEGNLMSEPRARRAFV